MWAYISSCVVSLPMATHCRTSLCAMALISMVRRMKSIRRLDISCRCMWHRSRQARPSQRAVRLYCRFRSPLLGRDGTTAMRRFLASSATRSRGLFAVMARRFHSAMLGLQIARSAMAIRRFWKIGCILSMSLRLGLIKPTRFTSWRNRPMCRRLWRLRA